MHERNHISSTGAAAHAQKDRKPRCAIIFVMLLVLTAISFWVANSHLMETATTGWTAMMAVSTTKAMLVILFFMNLWWEKRWKYALTVPVTIIGAVLVLILIPDVGNRFATYSKTRRSAAAEPDTSSYQPSSMTSNFESFANLLSPTK